MGPHPNHAVLADKRSMRKSQDHGGSSHAESVQAGADVIRNSKSI